MSLFAFVAFTFRMIGDAAHVASMVVLAKKIHKTRSFSGLSYNTQLLKMLVFITRYLDIFDIRYNKLLSIYNTLMKIAYISFQAALLYIIRFKYFHSYDPELDSFKIELLVFPGVLLAFFVSVLQGSLTLSDIFYNFSLLLESVAILPQLLQLQKMQESETLTSSYIFLLGFYRLFYLLNWIVKKLQGIGIDDVLFATGILQTVLYLHFFFLFYGYVIKRYGFNRIPK